MAQVYCILNAELEIIHVLLGVCLSVCIRTNIQQLSFEIEIQR